MGTDLRDISTGLQTSISKKIVMMLSTVLILAFGFLGASASASSLGCDGDVMPDGHVCESDGILHHYADPEDCHMFYDCYNGCLYHRTCPEHENWSRIHGYCDWDYNVDCGADPGPPGPDDFVCPEAQGVFEDPKNCAKYYRCSNFHATRNLCHSINGEQLLWFQDEMACDYPSRVECGDRPLCDKNDENCEEHHITTPAPTVCDGIACDHGDDFYPEGECEPCFCRCVGGAHFEYCCSPGLAFNPATNECDWTYNIDACE